MTSLCNRRFNACGLRRHTGPVLVVWLLCLSICGVLATPLRAEGIISRPYADLLRELDSREGFEAWPMRDEPGHAGCRARITGREFGDATHAAFPAMRAAASGVTWA